MHLLRRHPVVSTIAGLVLIALVVVSAVYSRESHQFLQRCQDAGPPPGTDPSQVVVTYEPDPLRNSLTCTWKGLPGSPTADQRSERSLPMFDSTQDR